MINTTLGRIFIFLAALNLAVSAAAETSSQRQPSSQSTEAGSQADYWAALQSLCGARFEGEMTFPESGQDSFAGKLLVASFKSCEAAEMQIPFDVGENKSRTWILRKVENGLELKHDHRHEDGSPDEITLYGGTTQTTGSALSQSFPADAYTAELIPEASTNVWSISLNETMDTLTYHLTRHDKPRFTAVLQRVREGE